MTSVRNQTVVRVVALAWWLGAAWACGDDASNPDATADSCDAGDCADAPDARIVSPDCDAGDCEDAVDGAAPVASPDASSPEFRDALDDLSERLDALECSAGIGEDCSQDGLALAAEALEPLVDAMCAAIFACCEEDEPAWLVGLSVTDEKQCRAIGRERLARGLPPWASTAFVDQRVGRLVDVLPHVADSIGAGRARIDEDAVAVCARRLQDAQCAPNADAECAPVADSPCQPSDVIVGQQPEGTVCDWSIDYDECGRGLVCRHGAATFDALCVRQADPGDACQQQPGDDHCDESRTGMYCDGSSGTCKPPGEEGDPCAYVDETLANSVAIARPCATNLSCDPASKTCVERCAAGYRCFGDRDCEAGLYCVPAGGATFSVCRPPQVGGARCERASDCASGVCAADPGDGGERHCLGAEAGELDLPENATCVVAAGGNRYGNATPACESLWCNAEGACAASPCDPAAAGSACSAGYFCKTVGLSALLSARLTAAGYVIDEDDVTPRDGVCVAVQPDGDGCLRGLECESGFCSAGSCRAPPSVVAGPEDACPSRTECGDALRCDSVSMTCVPRSPLNEDCTASWWCEFGLDCGPVAEFGGFVCVDRNEAPASSLCDSSVTCASGLLCDDHICRAPLAEAADCVEDDAPCSGDRYCLVTARDPSTHEPTAGVCNVRAPTGAPCDPNADVAYRSDGTLTPTSPGFLCASNTCAILDSTEYRCAIGPDFCDGI